MPGETIRLPSLGKFYTATKKELSDDVVNGEIVLHPMNMTDELLMKSPDMLFQGTAIDRVFRRCAPQILRPLDLLTADVDFILTHLRRISFGPYIDVKFTCQNKHAVPEEGKKKKGKSGEEESTVCGHEQEARVPLEYFTSQTKEITIEDITNNFILHTETDKRTVSLKPITFNDFLIMQQITPDSLLDADTMENYILSSVAAVINSVDDIVNNSEENRRFIMEWLAALPRSDSQLILDKIKNVQDWGPSFQYKVACSKCNHVNDLSTELNPTAFFIQPSSQTMKP